jgi:DNA polymerase-3 subunit alpha
MHTYFSFLDGMGSPEERVIRAKELGMKAIACTDHNSLAAMPEFQDACKKHGLKPIFGVEMYYTHDMSTIMLPKEDRDKIAKELAIKDGVEIKPKAKKTDIADLIAPYSYDTKGYHIILLAKNQKGWQNLVRIQSEAAEFGLFNGRYHCDNELLRKYSEGIIVTTACISSIVADAFKEGKDDTIAYETLLEWMNIFGNENVFCEIQGLDWDVQYNVNKKLIQVSKELEIGVIATNDVHYTFKDDVDDHDTLLCIGMGKAKADETRMRYAHEFWLKDYNEMIDSFMRLGGHDAEYMLEVVNALDNTNLIADMVEDNIMLGSPTPLFPKVDLPEGYDKAEDWLTRQCWSRLYKYLKKKDLKHRRLVYEKRLNEELTVINRKGFASYMLTVQDAIEWGDNNGCPFGPGRGSGAGSLVLFLLGIIKCTDPIEYNLLFSRFLTEDRTSPPDIDSDASYTGRQKLLRYLNDKYGHEHVSQVGTITTLGVKNGLKDVGKALEIPFSIMNNLNKEIDLICEDPGLSFKKLDKLAETDKIAYDKFVKLENANQEIFRLARRFEGTPRNMGIHAGGVLITPMPINDIFPTKMVDGRKVTVWDKDVVEYKNGIKFDFLGLKTVSVIDLALEHISESIGQKITWEDIYDNIDMADVEVFKRICNKETEALFQIESDLFKGIITDMQPTDINDIIALTSIGRPGPLQAGMHTKYNNRKNGLEDIVYPLPGLEDILSDSYGTIIYQEHCMLIAKKIAGFDDNQADSYLRKALAKGAVDKMELCRRWLIYGKKNEQAPKGYDESNTNQVMYDPQGKYGNPIKGAISNGYKIEELNAFWDDLKGYASYLFNKSHATSYSLLTVITGFLKTYYPVEFFAALFSVQDNEEKRARYVDIANNMGIEVSLPDINNSLKSFAPLPSENKILYGLGSIKGVGENSIAELIESRPYNTLEDLTTKVPKKFLNKRVGLALIKSGALDKMTKETNRNKLINQFFEIRKEKEGYLDENIYNKMACMKYEEETLGKSMTYRPWFNDIPANTKVEFNAEIISVFEKLDKNGNMMGFIKVQSEECTIELVAFSRTYCNYVDAFDVMGGTHIRVTGKKDEKGKVLVSKVSKLAMAV